MQELVKGPRLTPVFTALPKIKLLNSQVSSQIQGKTLLSYDHASLSFKKTDGCTSHMYLYRYCSTPFYVRTETRCREMSHVCVRASTGGLARALLCRYVSSRGLVLINTSYGNVIGVLLFVFFVSLLPAATLGRSAVTFGTSSGVTGLGQASVVNL